MAGNYTAFQLLDGFTRAVYVSRQEAASILDAQLLLCQLLTHQEDPLSGSYIALQSGNSNITLRQVIKSTPKTTAAGAGHYLSATKSANVTASSTHGD